MTPTPQDWQAWYANKSTKDLEIEAEERAEVEEDIELLKRWNKAHGLPADYNAQEEGKE